MATTNVAMNGIVREDMITVREEPDHNSRLVSLLQKGSKLTISKLSGSWCYASDRQGWVEIRFVALSNDPNRVASIGKDTNADAISSHEENEKQQLDRQIEMIEEDMDKKDLSDDEIVDSIIINNLNGIYGIPYQFMESVDPRLSKTNSLGRKYTEKIMSKIPLLCITPGTAEFMSNYSKDEQRGLLAALLNEGKETAIGDIIRKNGRYFTFAFDYNEYYKYVNGFAWAGARFLNIQDVVLTIGNQQAIASEFDWGKALNPNLKATFTSQEFIGFYMDSPDSVSESISNTTTQSQLSNAVNGFSDMAKELNFLLGSTAGKTLDILDADQLSSSMEGIYQFADNYLNGSNLFKRVASGFATVATGGKLIFPEIWSDTDFSRSFDITIKLRTPDMDTMSWYINNYIPLCHLLSLAAGHQIKDNPNGYDKPFLVRAYYKGMFNVDMGIVTGMSIRKGKEAAWNADGLPTELDIDLEIKDLYNMLAIVDASEPKEFVTNNLLMDYIANTCGININQMDIERSLEIYTILTTNKFKQLPNRIGRTIHDGVDNLIKNVYEAGMSFLI